MTHSDETPKNLGDLMAKWNTEGLPEPEPAAPQTRYSFEDGLLQLAEAYGENPAHVLHDYHGNSALARLARKVLAADTPAEDTAILVCFAVTEVRREGFKGAAAFEEARKRLNRRGRGISTTESIKTLSKRGKRRLDARLKAGRSLAALFIRDLSPR